jgi:hypothetical protein
MLRNENEMGSLLFISVGCNQWLISWWWLGRGRGAGRGLACASRLTEYHHYKVRSDDDATCVGRVVYEHYFEAIYDMIRSPEGEMREIHVV